MGEIETNESLPAPIRVLLLTDQHPLAKLVQLTLNHGVCLTRHTTDNAEALLILGTWHPQLAILDLDRGGVRFLAQLWDPRSRRTRIPVLAMSRRGDLRTKLEAFDKGVDDIMTLPFAPEELLARILVISRRRLSSIPPFNPILRFGGIEIDILNHQVRTGSAEVHLTSLELSLLYVLASHSGQIVTRDDILDALWGTEFMPDSNVVDRHIRSLREKLGDDWRRPRFISTVPGRGYTFIPVLLDEPAAT